MFVEEVAFGLWRIVIKQLCLFSFVQYLFHARHYVNPFAVYLTKEILQLRTQA